MRPRVVILGLLVAGAVLIVVVAALSRRGDMAQETAKKATTTAQKAQGAVVKTDKTARAAKAKTDKVQRQVERQVIKLDRTITVLGKAGVNGLPGKAGSAGPAGITGLQGPPGKVPFTLTEVLAGLSPLLTARLEDALPAALDVACGGSCNGKAGADGKDGRDAPAVTQEMVDLAMAHYCDVHNGCQGPQGVPGAASTTPGPPGPAGADGAPSRVPGPQGPPGQDAVFPATLTCVDNGNGTFTCTPG